jgi:hypothetical protein
MISGPGTGPIPVISAIRFPDRKIVDAGEPALHQTVLAEFPILVAVGTKPVAGIIVPFVGKANGNAIAGERP